MKASQAMLRRLSATRAVKSGLPIPATASAHKAVIPNAATNAVRGTLTAPSRNCDSASTANSSAAREWPHRMIVPAMLLARAFGPQDDADRLEQDQQVE